MTRAAISACAKICATLHRTDGSASAIDAWNAFDGSCGLPDSSCNSVTDDHAQPAPASRNDATGRPRHGKWISIDEILCARPQQPIATSRGKGWRGITVDVHRPYFNCAESYSALDHHLVCYCPSGSATLVQSRAGIVHRGVITAGTSYIMPAGYESAWEGDSGRSVRLRVPPSLVNAAADQLGYASTGVDIRNVFEVRDPMIEHLAQSLLLEIDRPAHPVQMLIADSLSNALAAHLLRAYSSPGNQAQACVPDRSLEGVMHFC